MIKQLLLKLFKIEYRPWGNYKIISHKDNKKIKEITVNPGEKLSLQKHIHRNEFWCFTQGIGMMVLDDETYYVTPGSTVYIPKNSKHRIENIGKVNLVFVEIATGSILDENDIIRFDDIYGRE